VPVIIAANKIIVLEISPVLIFVIIAFVLIKTPGMIVIAARAEQSLDERGFFDHLQ